MEQEIKKASAIGAQALKKSPNSLIVTLPLRHFPMIVSNADDFNALMEVLKGIKLQQKALAEDESSCREALQKIMKINDSDKETTIHGSVRLQQRANKQYNNDIQEMELAFKEAKKLADDLGDYEVLDYKESFVYTPSREDEELF